MKKLEITNQVSLGVPLLTQVNLRLQEFYKAIDDYISHLIGVDLSGLSEKESKHLIKSLVWRPHPNGTTILTYRGKNILCIEMPQIGKKALNNEETILSMNLVFFPYKY